MLVHCNSLHTVDEYTEYLKAEIAKIEQTKKPAGSVSKAELEQGFRWPNCIGNATFGDRS